MGGGISRSVKCDNSLATVVMEEVKIAATRGRNPDNPSERKRSNGKYKQRLEINENGTSNTITSVLIDNLVIEPNVLTPKRTEFGKRVRKQYESGELNMSRHDMTKLEPRTDGVSNTLTSVLKDNLLAEPLRYRRLTPRECFRLMDVDEVVIDKIQAAGISNSQQYKLAGNSIVVACLEKIFEQMFFPQCTNSRTLFG